MTSSVFSFLYFYPEYANLNPQLFAKYIPNVLPPTKMEDLPLYIAETQRLQEELLVHQGYNR